VVIQNARENDVRLIVRWHLTGGIDLGLERAGMTCRWQVEIDDYCQKVLAKHWPDVRRFGDIRECGAHNLETVDLICGGFPCQDISLAGKGAGIEGARSGLWSEYHRIICELRPRYVLVENVSALLVRGIDRVLGDLAESGYDAEWDCIPAAAVGAPHRRDRVFVVAYSGSLRCNPRRAEQSLQGAGAHGQAFMANPQGITERTGLRKEEQTGKRGRRSGHGDSQVPDARRQLLEGFVQAGTAQGTVDRPSLWASADWWAAEPQVGGLVDGVPDGVVRFAGRVAKGVPNRVAKLRGLGNAVVPQLAEYLGRLIAATEEGR